MKVVGSATIAMPRAVQLRFLSTAANALLTCAIHACTCSVGKALQRIGTPFYIWKRADCFIKIRLEIGDVLFVEAQVTI